MAGEDDEEDTSAGLLDEAIKLEPTLPDSSDTETVPLSTLRRRKSRYRCYDFINIFAEKFGDKNDVFDSKQS
jgi:hypothetical protein